MFGIKYGMTWVVSISPVWVASTHRKFEWSARAPWADILDSLGGLAVLQIRRH